MWGGSGVIPRVFFVFTTCNSIRGAVGLQTLIRVDSGCFGADGLKVLLVKSWRRGEIASQGREINEK